MPPPNLHYFPPNLAQAVYPSALHEDFIKIGAFFWTMTNEKDETFFVGKDVAKALGYAKPQNALATHVDKEDKTTAPIQGTGSKYMIYYQDGAKMMRPVLTREQYLALRGSEQQKANLKADSEVKGYSIDLTTSCTTNPASMKPKMAVMWAMVPLPRSSGSTGFWFCSSSSE